MSANAAPFPLKFQIGARTLVAIHRRLVRVPLSLDDVLAGRAPILPTLPREAEGHLVTSLPVDHTDALIGQAGRKIAWRRQYYTRYYVDLTGDFAGWMAALSANARSQLKRKAKRIAAESGGRIDVRSYRTVDEIEAFHALARSVARTTYQERLMAAGLPDTPDFRREIIARAAAGSVRAWLLFIAERPVAYLYCPVDDGNVRYEYVGHDPAFGALSPGSVLQMEAMRDLFAEGSLRQFDFTEGEGQHKRQMATGEVECLDLLLLRPTLINRATVTALAGFNTGVAAVKRMATRTGLGGMARIVRRG